MRTDDGPAFPIYTPDMNVGDAAGPGMSLRDWFAGHALAGLLASNAMYGGRTDLRASVAADAYAHADAMLAARQPADTENQAAA